MKIELLKNCIMIFELNTYHFVFQQKTELKDVWAQILIDGGYAKKIGIVRAIKDAVVSKNIASKEMENKAILSSDIENKGNAFNRPHRGRPRKKLVDE